MYDPSATSPLTTPDITLYNFLSVMLVTLLVGFVLAGMVRCLQRTRPDFRVGAPLATGLGFRLLAVAAVATTGVGPTLRGGDELVFLNGAREVAGSGLGAGSWLPSESHRLHEIVFALQLKLGNFPEASLRITQIGIALAGMLLLLAAIYDLAGAHAARLGGWVLALEPTAVFYNSLLHREALLVLASGLVVLGGAKIWAKLDIRGVALLGLGCAIATATRPYAGWFLITSGILLVLHASFRQMGSQLRSVPLVYAVAIVVAVAAPAVLQLTSQDSLEQNLQTSQDANASPTATRGGANSNNLSLERVDFSTRSELVLNLPMRMRDVVLRPYPWHIDNASQRFGAIGTLVVLMTLYLLLRCAIRNWGRILTLTAPILYPCFCLLTAYALSVGNAGTGFRYRTHLVLLALVALVVLRERALRDDAAVARRTAHQPSEVRAVRRPGHAVRGHYGGGRAMASGGKASTSTTTGAGP